MAKWLAHLSLENPVTKSSDRGVRSSTNYKRGWSVLHYCAQYQGETLMKLVEKGADYFSKEEMAKWLSQVETKDANVLLYCARHHFKTLMELVKYGEVCLSEEDGMANWLSCVDKSGWSLLHILGLQKEGEPLRELVKYGERYLQKEQMGKWLARVNEEGYSVLHFCAANHNQVETLISLLDYGEKYMTPEQREEWLLQRVKVFGWRVLFMCAENPNGGETLIKLLEYGDKYLPEEELAKWLSHVMDEGISTKLRSTFFARTFERA
uniref:Uncharacterized protein n=1 Tax=Rhodosorus marinus TaxID=101924 RepID=A0A7S0G1I9_9RHOD|mmetsp:Transcript_13436/g.19370  ORF Transcript_13436/g.19370 Transcript_13436/m.19370 type:complete len:266 (+) Transcript_13436:138-935(+)